MRGFLTLHQSGKARFLQGGSGTILINPKQIQAVISGDEESVGAYIYLIGEEDALMVDEDLDTINGMILLS